MKLNSKTVLVNGNPVTVIEENWDVAIKLQLVTDEHSKTPLPDARQQYFAVNFYDAMAACSQGEFVPDIGQALSLLGSVPAEIDGWYCAVVDVNPKWFAPGFSPRPASEKIEFRDGASLLVTEIRAPSALMRLYDLEQAAITEPDDDLPRQLFKQAFWPKLAASVATGQLLPPMEEVRAWPSSEIDIWYGACKRLNPGMFAPFDALLNAAQADADELKKKAKRKHH